MRQSTPNNQTPTSANRRGSMNGSFRMSGGGSMFQRGNDPLRKSRVSTSVYLPMALPFSESGNRVAFGAVTLTIEIGLLISRLPVKLQCHPQRRNTTGYCPSCQAVLTTERGRRVPARHIARKLQGEPCASGCRRVRDAAKANRRAQGGSLHTTVQDPER